MSSILLIEPDVVLGDVYARGLRQAGHKAAQATTAQTAIDAADDVVPDVVLLELQLVAHSGIEFLYEFRSYPEWQTVPVIILSHVPPAAFRASAGVLRDQLGVRDYYYKPQVGLDRLLRIVDEALLAHRKRT